MTPSKKTLTRKEIFINRTLVIAQIPLLILGIIAHDIFHMPLRVTDEFKRCRPSIREDWG